MPRSRQRRQGRRPDPSSGSSSSRWELEPPWPPVPAHRAEVKSRQPGRAIMPARPRRVWTSRRWRAELAGRSTVRRSSDLNGESDPPCVPGRPAALPGQRSCSAPSGRVIIDFASGSPGSTGRGTRARSRAVRATWFAIRRHRSRGQQEPAHWTNVGASAGDGVTFGVDDPHRSDLGRRSLRMHVPATAPAGWRGWQQDVPIRARSYVPRWRPR